MRLACRLFSVPSLWGFVQPVMISATKCNHSRYEQLRRTGQRGDDAPAGTPTEVRKARARKSKQVRKD